MCHVNLGNTGPFEPRTIGTYDPRNIAPSGHGTLGTLDPKNKETWELLNLGT